MVIISGSSHPILAQQVADGLGCEFIIANTKRFVDQELNVQINKDLYDRNVILLQSINRPVNDHLMELLLLAYIAKKSGCRSITAVIPYFGYSRQDKPSYEYGSASLQLIAKLVEASGIDKIITVDMHSKKSEDFFNIAIKSLDPTEIFITELKRNDNDIVVSPDIGGVPRAMALASKLKTDLAIIDKRRDFDGKCTMYNITRNVAEKNCIIIDDIVDTADTLCKAAKLLIQNGAKTIRACVTHAVFSANCIHQIEQIGFTDFFITDTISHHTLPSFIQIIPISRLIMNALSHLSLIHI